jgi:uncharacterized DUF497 family protein
VITFDEDKRQANIAKHGIDLAECESIFDWPMVTMEDTRGDYGEQRLQSLGWLGVRVVMLIWTERDDSIRLISCRYGDKHETRHYFEEAY